MYVLKLLGAIALAVLVHLVGVQVFPGFVQAMDVFVVVVVLHALEGESLAGLLVGLVVGLLHDTLTGGPFGLFVGPDQTTTTGTSTGTGEKKAK